LPESVTALDVAASPSRPEVFVLVRDIGGKARVLSWEVSNDSTSLLFELPNGLTGSAIASHPDGRSLFVAGTTGGRSHVFKLDHDGAAWRSTVIFESPRPISRLIVAPRPFSTANGDRYRLFFAAKLSDGGSSLRSVTETGQIEYQVVGPQAGVDSLKSDDQPTRVVGPSAIPMAFHPRGEPLLWQDRRGCAHLLPYDLRDWSADTLLNAVPCGATLSITPNGAGYLAWRSGVPGVALLERGGRMIGQQANTYTFLAAPVWVPDGRGVVGVVSKGGTRTALTYVPTAVPMADVTNAWQLSRTPCDERLFVGNAGLFRERDNIEQLYSLYESYDYGRNYPPPFLVTTDLMWENFGAAFNGVFILLERRQAAPAFRSFVDAASSALGRTSPGSLWAKAFAALAAFYRGDDSGEAGRIAHGTGEAHSTVLDSAFDYGELVARGHYTSSPEMERYFRSMHYLTTLGRLRDPIQLASLPPEVQRKAVGWIDVYRPFVAPPRSRLLWAVGAASQPATYAKHPWPWQSMFPLSWGLDNEVLESTVHHDTWPADEQIVGPNGRRLHPSGLDVAAVFGSSLARSLLAGDLSAYPRLRPVLDGIAARRPDVTESSTLYERWMDALGVEWADSSAVPGTRAQSPVWPAKRLQTGLASWATLREATILVNERAAAAEAGEGGFEELLIQHPRGYVEPAPRTFESIAGLYEALARTVAGSHDLDSTGGAQSNWTDEPLRQGIQHRLAESAAEARRFGQMARKELAGEALPDSDYDAIRSVGGSVEHQFLVYKSLANKDLALSVPDPLPRIADVAGDGRLGLLEVAVGGPMEWDQLVPFFGRREIVIGSVYSYYEFLSQTPYNNERWRREAAQHPRPAWVQPLIAPTEAECRAAASR
jgi:hypothetical protein